MNLKILVFEVCDHKDRATLCEDRFVSPATVEQDLARFRENARALMQAAEAMQAGAGYLPRDLQTVADAILAGSRFLHIKLSGFEHNDPLRRIGHLVAPLLALPNVKAAKRATRAIKSIAVD